MSSSATAAAATNNNDDIARDEVRSANDRKRKAEEQGGRGDAQKSKEISDEEEEERSIKQLVCYDLWSEDSETVEKATYKLKDLTYEDEDKPNGNPYANENCLKVVQGGGHIVMLKNVEKSVGDKERHEFIDDNLIVLMNLSCNNKNHKKVIREHPMVADTIVKIMQNFADRCECCSSACGVLGNLAFNDSACGVLGNLAVNDDDFKVELFEAGLIPLAVESMRRFVNNEDMQRLGSHLLRQLLTSKKETEKIVDAANACKALTVLSEAKYNFPDHQVIKKFTTACIKALNKD